MQNIYDLVVIGKGFQASLLLLEAAKKGLKVAWISNKDCIDNTDNEAFLIIQPKLVSSLFNWLKQKKIIHRLKKSASYLFLSTELKHYRSITLWTRLLVYLTNLFQKEKIKVFKANKYILFKTYKLSIARISVAIANTVKDEYDRMDNTKAVSIEHLKNEDYKLLLKHNKENKSWNIQTKSILVVDNKSPLFVPLRSRKAVTKRLLYFVTYPTDKLNLEKNMLIDEKVALVKVIPWFDKIYFELESKKKKQILIEEFIDIIKDHLPDIEISTKNILQFGNYQKYANTVNKKATQAVLYHKNTRSDFKYDTLQGWFNYSSQIINHIIKKINTGNLGKPVLENTEIKGNDYKLFQNTQKITEYADERYDEAKQILKSPRYFKKLFYRYGTDIEIITNLAYEYWNKSKNINQAWLKAEICHAINNEYCSSSEDFINNRTEEWLANSIDIEFIQKTFAEFLN